VDRERERKTQKPNRLILDRPTHRASFVSCPHVAASLARRVNRRERQSAHQLQPGRPVAQLNHCDGRFDKRHVGLSEWTTRPRPSAGSNLRRDNLKPQERRRAQGVESDTVTRVTTGRLHRRPSSRDGNNASFDAERGPTRPRDSRPAGSGTPAAESRRRMTCGRATRNDAATRRTAERPDQNARLDPRRVDRANSARAENRKDQQPSPMRGCSMLQEHQGEGGGDARQRSKRDRRCDGIARHNAT